MNRLLVCLSCLLALLTGMNGQQALAFTALNLPFGLALLLGVAILLVANIALGVLTRAAPQLNIFSIGFPLTLVLGLFIVWVGLADILNQYQPLASEALQWLRELARAS